MKREINCTECKRSWVRNFQYMQQEGLKVVPGLARHSYVCDGCGIRLPEGEFVWAISVYTPTRPYFEWESESIDVLDRKAAHSITLLRGAEEDMSDAHDAYDRLGGVKSFAAFMQLGGTIGLIWQQKWGAHLAHRGKKHAFQNDHDFTYSLCRKYQFLDTSETHSVIEEEACVTCWGIAATWWEYGRKGEGNHEW